MDYVISRGLMVATRFRAWHPWRLPLPTSPHVLVLVLVLVLVPAQGSVRFLPPTPTYKNRLIVKAAGAAHARGQSDTQTTDRCSPRADQARSRAMYCRGAGWGCVRVHARTRFRLSARCLIGLAVSCPEIARSAQRADMLAAYQLESRWGGARDQGWDNVVLHGTPPPSSPQHAASMTPEGD